MRTGSLDEGLGDFGHLDQIVADPFGHALQLRGWHFCRYRNFDHVKPQLAVWNVDNRWIDLLGKCVDSPNAGLDLLEQVLGIDMVLGVDPDARIAGASGGINAFDARDSDDGLFNRNDDRFLDGRRRASPV